MSTNQLKKQITEIDLKRILVFYRTFYVIHTNVLLNKIISHKIWIE